MTVLDFVLLFFLAVALTSKLQFLCENVMLHMSFVSVAVCVVACRIFMQNVCEGESFFEFSNAFSASHKHN